VDFLLIQNLDAESDRQKPADISHTIIQDAVHKMRQFWSMRSNKWQHIAQTLRFERHEKQGIIEIAPDNCTRFPISSGG
jgi:hypothetical protein